MNLPDHLLPGALAWLLNTLALLLLLAAGWRAPWRRLGDSARLNLWLGACVGMMLLWSIKAGIKPGLDFHLLGATLMTLMFGPTLALLGLGIVLIGVTLAGMAGWTALGANLLLMAALPVAFSHALYRQAERRLPPHLFIYILLDAFIGAALAMTLSGVAATLLLALAGVYPWHYLADHYLPYYALMCWSEAMLTGMAATMMTVYRPGWLATFDDARYFGSR